MAIGLASGVRYASHINEAYSLFGVSPALLQGMLDYDSVDLFDLPEKAIEYANAYAQQYGGSSYQARDAKYEPRFNIIAAGWYLYQMLEMYGSDGEALSMFYNGGPVGRIKATRIICSTYEKRKRQWS